MLNIESLHHLSFLLLVAYDLLQLSVDLTDNCPPFYLTNYISPISMQFIGFVVTRVPFCQD